MNKSFFTLLILAVVLLTVSCKVEDDPTIDNPNVISQQTDTTLRSFYLKPSPSATFESIYSYNFTVVNCSFDIDLYWYDPVETHGVYLHFSNSVGDVLTDAAGFIKAFDSGVNIDSTLAGSWSGGTDGIFAFDYVSNPSADKGNLAGMGDKYVVFRAFSSAEPSLKYYGWMRVRVSENGRSVSVISIGYQKDANTGLRTGEL